MFEDAPADCNLTDISASVILPVPPIDDNSPPFLDDNSPPMNTTLFTVSFTCNGITHTSPELSTPEEALQYAQSSWGNFGTWSLAADGITLVITNSICGAIGLGHQATTEIIYGCTDSTALNFNPEANVNQGCMYPVDPTPDYITPICSTFTITSDIPYSSVDATLVMDSYVETCNPSNVNRPVFIFCHGGGGVKTDLPCIDWCEYFASRGYFAVSIEYGQTGAGTSSGFTSAMQKQAAANLCACIRHIRANHLVYGINKLNIFTNGSSAGALTSIQGGMVAYALDNGTFLTGYAVNAENAAESSVPTATATMSGASTNTFLSKLSLVNSPPNFFYHGLLDCKIMYSIARCLSNCGVLPSLCVSGALDTYNTYLAAGFTNCIFIQYPLNGHGLGGVIKDDIRDNTTASGLTGQGGIIIGGNTIPTGLKYQYANLLSP